jgi:ATP-binding cassette subfamily B protein
VQPTEQPADGTDAPVEELGGRRRAGRNARFVVELIKVHPRLFAVAVAGAAVFALLTVASSFAIGQVIDDVILPRFEDGEVSTGTVLRGLGLVIGIGVVRSVAIVIRRSFASITMWRTAQTFTNQVVRRYVEQPASWHNRRADGDLVQRAGVDSEATVSVLAPIPFATGTVVMLIASTIWMLIIDVPLGLVAVVVFPLLLVTNVVYEKSVSVHFTRAQDQLGEFSAGVHESFEGVQLVKSYGAEDRETARLGRLADHVRASRVHAIRLRSLFEAVLDVMPSITNIVLVVIGAYRVRSGDVTIGEFSSVIFLFTLLIFPLRLIGYTLSELPRSMAAWRRIRAVLDEPVEPDPADALGVADERFGVEFDGVGFAHDGDGPPTVNGIDLSVQRGSVTALVGPTGSGKSTIAQLAVGLVGPNAGEVRLQPGARAIVFQEAFLLSGTVRDNIETRHRVLRRRHLGGARAGGGDRLRRTAPTPARHGGRRARREPQWWPTTAARVGAGPRSPTEPACPRRHHLGTRPVDRGAHPRPSPVAIDRLDGVDGGVASLDDRPRRRRGLRGRRQDRCARHPRRVADFDPGVPGTGRGVRVRPRRRRVDR